MFELFGKLDTDEEAIAADLPDLVRFFVATGERTGEALAADWEDFDSDAKQLTMAGNVIRAIPLADWCVTMLDNRHGALGWPASGPIVPSSTGTIREASNVRNRAWNPFKQRAGFEWVTFRTFRKTVATMLDDAGLTARQIADILGHAHPSMTQDVYMGRGAVSRGRCQRAGCDVGKEVSFGGSRSRHDVVHHNAPGRTVGLTWHNPNSRAFVEGPEIAIRPVGVRRLHPEIVLVSNPGSDA